MFDQPTVFILGAGASWHYNYPTGEELVQEIKHKTEAVITCFENENKNFETSPPYKERPPANIPQFFLDRREKPSGQNFCKNDVFDSIKFLENFLERIKDVDPPVIDYFLGQNPDLQDIGKLMIAWVILDREREYSSDKPGNRNRQRLIAASPVRPENPIDIKKYKDNWYRFVLYKIVGGCKTSGELVNNKVHFVTFNYDVSLETFLYRGLRAIKFLRGNDKDIDSFLKERFIHVYGQVRHDHFTSFEYIKEPPSNKIIQGYKEILDRAYEASKGIRTIEAGELSGDKNGNEKEREQAGEIIDKAQCVYILGYGFDDNNSKRLNLAEGLSLESAGRVYEENDQYNKKEIYFTNFGDRNSVNKKVSSLITKSPKTFLSGKESICEYSSSQGYSLSCEKSTKNVYDALADDFSLT